MSIYDAAGEISEKLEFPMVVLAPPGEKR